MIFLLHLHTHVSTAIINVLLFQGVESTLDVRIWRLKSVPKLDGLI